MPLMPEINPWLPTLESATVTLKVVAPGPELLSKIKVVPGAEVAKLPSLIVKETSS
jgi:hypothetical protein